MSRGLAPSFANDEASRAEHKPRHAFVAHEDFHLQSGRSEVAAADLVKFAVRPSSSVGRAAD